MTQLIFATNNQHKVQELKALLNGRFGIITLAEAGIQQDIPEPHNTLEENASEKSRTIFRLTGKDCFGEDTGLEVFALNGAPGVKSARYAGPGNDATKNMNKLLQQLEGEEHRKAQFRTIISLILAGQEYFFEGVCPGQITHEPAGTEGFGYDPVFVPDGATLRFAQMDLAEKNRFSHRARAVQQLADFLLTYAKNNQQQA